jgi:hypothetical protein
MKQFLFATVAALTLSAGIGSAYAAQTTYQSIDTWVNNKPPAFVYNPGS